MAQEGFPKTQNGGSAATQPPPSLFLGTQYPTTKYRIAQAARAMAKARAVSSASSAYLTGLVAVDIHGHMIRSKIHLPPLVSMPPPKNPRGNVTSFSSASRRRLMRFFASINPDLLSHPLFLSLTFHWRKDKTASYRALAVYLKSVRRRYADAQWLWRMEFQKRGVVHFHMFLWRGPRGLGNEPSRTYENWLHDEWHRVAQPNSDAHAEHGALVEPVRNASKAMAYLTKYMSKELEHDFQLTGRRWGHSNGIPRAPIATAQLDELQHVAYLRVLRRLVCRSHPQGAEGCAPKLTQQQRAERRAAAGISDEPGTPTPNDPRPFQLNHRRRLFGYINEARETHTFVLAETAFRILTQICRVTFDPATRETTPPWYQTIPQPEAIPNFRSSGLSREQLDQVIRLEIQRQKPSHRPRRPNGKTPQMRKSRPRSETQQLALPLGTMAMQPTQKPGRSTQRTQTGSTPPPSYPPKAKNWPKSSSPAGDAREATTRRTAHS